MRRRRPGWNALVVVAAGFAVLLLHRAWVVAQAEAAVVLTTTLETPVLAPIVSSVTSEPLLADTVIAGTPALVTRPSGDGDAPALVVVNGATQHGRRHPTVRRLAEGLARSGYVVVVHDPPGLRRGEITERTLESTIAVAREVARREGGVGFLGVSVGASLALAAAADAELAGDVTVVGGIAPYADLRGTIRMATTRPDAEPFLRLVIARSLAGGLPAGPDRRRLVERMAAVAWESQAPLATLRREPPADLGPAGQAVVDLLLNEDPERFDELYAVLPAGARAGIERLSPLAVAGAIRAPVELASAPRDRYFPLDESEALVRAAPDARLTVTGTLQHAVPRATPRGVLDLARLDGFAVRVLRAARA